MISPLGRRLRALAAAALLAATVLPLTAAPVAAAPTELFFSEYIEGSSNNKALEIYNGTGAPVNLSTGAYSVQMFFNGAATPGLSIALAGTLASGDVYVLAHVLANAEILAQADQTNGSGWYNGDDAVVLRKGTTSIDVIGQTGVDPGTEWGTGLTSTADNTLRRKSAVEAGDANAGDAFDPAAEWDGFATDNSAGLGVHPGLRPPSLPNLSIDDVTLGEGDGGTAAFAFTVSLSAAAPAGGTTFDIATADGTATIANGDYTASSLTGQSIPAGSQTYTFSVTVTGDTTSEADETFLVNVTNVTGAVVTDGQGVGTILDDEVDACTLAYTPIPQIQGSGSSAAITGNVTTQGVVVGDFEGTTAASGFYLQDATGDGNAATSDGIFVFTGNANLASVGDVVRVTGFARERNSQTTINGGDSSSTAVPAANVVACGTGAVAETQVQMPLASTTFLERYEGMLVRFPQPLVISEYFNYDRFGEIVLALPLDGEPRHFSGTAIAEPGAAANARTAANALRRITLDDVQSTQNPARLRHPNGDAFSLANRFRGGDLVANAKGVLGFDFSLYRILPTAPADYTAVNARPESPDPVGQGSVRVAAMNTLNYFLTLDATNADNADTPGPCGGNATLDCRGADASQPNEFARQRAKLLAALAGLDADIIGLNEIENTPGVEPLADIVAGLNDLPGDDTYAYIDTGVIGTDAIRVGLIYRTGAVTPLGAHAVLTSAVDPRFIDTRSRPVVAQTFVENATGGILTVAVNHLKSKGSACAGDPDAGDGQGNCNGTRTLAAQALVDWLATDPTGSGDGDFLIVGDLNSYAKEDPIDAVAAGSDDTAGTGDDYTNLIADFLGEFAYSYTFDGQAGYLDHALANAALLGQVTGVADWHINSDEPDVVDYDTSFKPPAQAALYEPNAYRSSDHDAVVVGLDLEAPPAVDAGGPYSVVEGTSIALTATGIDPDGDPITYEWDLDGNGSFETPGQSVTFTAPAGAAPASVTVTVRGTDPLGLTGSDAATVSIIWNFDGFIGPVDNPDDVNVMKAGPAVPFNFTLGGDQGLAVIAEGYPISQKVACDPSDTGDPIEATSTAGKSTLSYDPATGTYTYAWKTDKSWAGTCRNFTLKLTDGTEHSALFEFTP